MTAIRPPEYFPRLAYCAHAAACGTLVLANTFQYSRQTYQNRTRIRLPQGAHWLSVPLRGGQHGRPICDVEIDNRHPWARTHWRTLTYNYSSAPFFEHYAPVVHDLLFQSWECLSDLTCATVELLLRALSLSIPLRRASALEPPLRSLADAGRHAQGGLLISVESAQHDAAQITPTALFTYREAPRRQNFPGFQPGLSTLDLLFNYGPDAAALLRSGIAVSPFAEGSRTTGLRTASHPELTSEQEIPRG